MPSNIGICIYLHKLIILLVYCFKVMISYTEYLIFLFIFIVVFSIASIADHSYNFDIFHRISNTGYSSITNKFQLSAYWPILQQ